MKSVDIFMHIDLDKNNGAVWFVQKTFLYIYMEESNTESQH